MGEHGDLQLGNQSPQQTRAKKPKAPESVTPVHHAATNLEFGPIRLGIYRHLDNTDRKTGDEQLAEKGKQPQRQERNNFSAADEHDADKHDPAKPNRAKDPASNKK